MRAYYFDNIPGDQRLKHDSLKPVGLDTLKSINVEYFNVPVDGHERFVDDLALKRSYKSRDIVNVSKELLGDKYEERMSEVYREHMHEDEEIRYILAGSGFFDVRETPSDAWVRIAVSSGDLLVLPAGIYHRFTLDESDKITTLRLFKDVPKWQACFRDSGETDQHPHRLAYLKSISASA